MANGLPEGFTLDTPQEANGLPEGFTLDAPQEGGNFTDQPLQQGEIPRPQSSNPMDALPPQSMSPNNIVTERKKLLYAELVRRKQALTSEDMRKQARDETISEMGGSTAYFYGMHKGLKKFERGLGLADLPDQEEKEFYGELEEQRPFSTGAGEITGEVLPMAPAFAVGAGPTTLLGRMGTTGMLNAMEGAILAKGSGGDKMDMAMMAALSGVFGLNAELMLPIVTALGRKIFQKVRGKIPQNPLIVGGKPTAEFKEMLDTIGTSFEDLTEDAVNIISEGKVKPDQVVRKDVLEKTMGKDTATKAQMTRSATDFQIQEEIAKPDTIVRKRLEAQEQILDSEFKRTITKTEGTPIQSGSPIVDVVLTEKAATERAVGEAYDKAREISKEMPTVTPDGVVKTIKDMRYADGLMNEMPSAMKGELVNMGIIDDNFQILRNITVGEADILRKLTSPMYSSTTDYGRGGIRQIKDSIDNDVAEAVGEDVFKPARDMYADFKKRAAGTKRSKYSRRSKEIINDIIEDKIGDEKMFEKIMLNPSTRAADLADIKMFMKSSVDKKAGEKAIKDLKAETLQYIKNEAFKGAVDEKGAGEITRRKLDTVLKKIGDKRLKVLFNAKELKFFEDMKAVTRLREPVNRTGMGKGPSAQGMTIARLEKFMRDAPIFGKVFKWANIDLEGRAMIKASPEKIYTPDKGAMGSFKSKMKEERGSMSFKDVTDPLKGKPRRLKTKDPLTTEARKYKSAEELAKSLEKDFKADVRMYETKDGDIKLDHLVVKKGQRKEGVGSDIMKRITSHADQNGKRILLTTGVKDPHMGTTSGSRLKKFYKRFGFVENRGRNKDFRLSETMYRDAQKGK